MKKLIALAALAACLPTFAGTVTSSNTVGYTKVNLDEGYNMIGVQFVDIGGDAKDLATVATLDKTMAGFDDDEEFATTMMVWANGNYTTYGWSGTSGTDVYEDDSIDNMWLTRRLDIPTGVTIAESGAFWIKAGSAGSVLIYGEVPESDVTVPLSAGYNMVANPFPKDVPVATFGQLSADMAGFDDDEEFATTMMVWANGNYTTYGWSGTSGTDVYEDDSIDNMWLTRRLDIPSNSVVIPAGHAVWIKAGSAGSITFTAE